MELNNCRESRAQSWSVPTFYSTLLHSLFVYIFYILPNLSKHRISANVRGKLSGQNMNSFSFGIVVFHDFGVNAVLKSPDEASQQNDLKQMHWHSWPEGTTGCPCEEFGIFGRWDNAVEGGVDVSEVVLQSCHLLCILLCGEDLWGKLSQLRRKHNSIYLQHPGKPFKPFFS